MIYESLKNRIIRDYFTPSRSEEYKNILDMALRKDYLIIGLWDFYNLLKNNKIANDQKVLCLRHDVDIINPKATRTFFEIENGIGAKATYYFRYSTINKNLEFLRKLQNENFEVGYHFEEISAYAKKNYIENKETLIANINEIRNIFVKNINFFKESYAADIKSICSHGDWINDRLNLSNETLVTEKLIRELNLDFEAYQSKLTSLFDVYVSDVADFPQRWSKEISAQSVINNNIKRIYMLTHERFWFTNPFYNTFANLQSLFEQIKFKVGSYFKKRQVR